MRSKNESDKTRCIKCFSWVTFCAGIISLLIALCHPFLYLFVLPKIKFPRRFPYSLLFMSDARILIYASLGLLLIIVSIIAYYAWLKFQHRDQDIAKENNREITITALKSNKEILIAALKNQISTSTISTFINNYESFVSKNVSHNKNN